jgi:hypothetical protein
MEHVASARLGDLLAGLEAGLPGEELAVAVTVQILAVLRRHVPPDVYRQVLQETLPGVGQLARDAMAAQLDRHAEPN